MLVFEKPMVVSFTSVPKRLLLDAAADALAFVARNHNCGFERNEKTHPKASDIDQDYVALWIHDLPSEISLDHVR